MRQRGDVIVLAVIGGFGLIFLFGYLPEALFTKLRIIVNTKSWWTSTDWLVLAKPIFVFTLGACLCATLLWILASRQDKSDEEEGDYVPWVVAAGAACGALIATAGSLVPAFSSGVTFLFYSIFNPIFMVMPLPGKPIVMQVYLFLLSTTVPFLSAILGARIAWNVTAAVPKSILIRLLAVSVPLLILTALTFSSYGRGDFFREASNIHRGVNKKMAHSMSAGS